MATSASSVSPSPSSRSPPPAQNSAVAAADFTYTYSSCSRSQPGLISLALHQLAWPALKVESQQPGLFELPLDPVHGGRHQPPGVHLRHLHRRRGASATRRT